MLSPAEQLRRHLLRISRHHTDASIEVQGKLKRMQENIAPFVNEWNTVTCNIESDVSKSKGTNHMTPCFASRVPTGRIPREAKDAKFSNMLGDDLDRMCGTRQSKGLKVWRSTYSESPPPSLSKSGRAGYRVNRREAWSPQTAQENACENTENLIDEDARLTQALEEEIAHFFNSLKDSTDHVGTGGPPQYRFLKRARQKGDAGPMRTSARHASGANARFAFGMQNESDSELAELEEDAGMLEAQLAWWRQHRETLLSFSEYPSQTVPIPSSRQDQDAELLGHSDWLRLPSPSDATNEPSATDASTIHAAVCNDDPQPTLPKCLAPENPPAASAGVCPFPSSIGAATREVSAPGALCEMVAEQAKELAKLELLTEHLDGSTCMQSSVDIVETGGPNPFSCNGVSEDVGSKAPLDTLGTGQLLDLKVDDLCFEAVDAPMAERSASSGVAASSLPDVRCYAGGDQADVIEVLAVVPADEEYELGEEQAATNQVAPMQSSLPSTSGDIAPISAAAVV